MKYKLIALDLDGTLKNSQNKITPLTKEVLIKAQEMGIKVVLASGRPTPGLRHEAKELELEKYGGYLLSFNGASIIEYRSQTPIYQKTLSMEEAKEIYRYSKNYQLACLTYDHDVIISENVDDEYVCIEANINDIQKKKVEKLDENIKDPVYKVLLTGKPNYVASIIDDFKKPYSDKLSIYRSAPYFIEVMAKDIDKAQSLNCLIQHLGISKDEVIAFGDGYNDLSMIEFAGLGVAMANAVDEVKNKADRITKSNDEDGIAFVLKEVIEGMGNIMLPKDPAVLLSFLNTRLRDQYSHLDDLCDDLNVSKSELEQKMAKIEYVYNKELNQFK